MQRLILLGASRERTESAVEGLLVTADVVEDEGGDGHHLDVDGGICKNPQSEGVMQRAR